VAPRPYRAITLRGDEVDSATEPTNFNRASAAAEPIVWDDPGDAYDDDWFDWDSGKPELVVVKKAGDYLLCLNLPLHEDDAVGVLNNRARIQAKVLVEGTAHGSAIGRNSYMRLAAPATTQEQGTTTLYYYLQDLSVNDEISIEVEGIASTSNDVSVDGKASLTVWAFPDAGTANATRQIFCAEFDDCGSTPSTNLNQATAQEVNFETPLREDNSYSWSGSTPTDIEIDNAGTYVIFLNCPLEGSITRGSVEFQLKEDGTDLKGSPACQGYIRNANSDTKSSVAGVFVTTHDGDGTKTITLEVSATAASGTITTGTGLKGQITIIQFGLGSGGEVAWAGGTALDSGTAWNQSTAQYMQFNELGGYYTPVYAFFPTSGVTRYEIRVKDDAYYLVFMSVGLVKDSGTAARQMVEIELFSDGTAHDEVHVANAYIRDYSSHEESSLSLAILLDRVTGTPVDFAFKTGTANAGDTTDDVEDINNFRWGLIRIGDLHDADLDADAAAASTDIDAVRIIEADLDAEAGAASADISGTRVVEVNGRRAVYLEGASNHYLKSAAGDYASFELQAESTYEVWFKIHTVVDGACILAHWDTLLESNSSFQLYLTSANYLRVQYIHGAFPNTNTKHIQSDMETGVWYHLLLEFDTNGESINWRLSKGPTFGTYVESADSEYTGAPSCDKSMRVGASYTQPAGFKGWICKLRHYPALLDADEHRELWNAGRGRHASELQALGLTDPLVNVECDEYSDASAAVTRSGYAATPDLSDNGWNPSGPGIPYALIPENASSDFDQTRIITADLDAEAEPAEFDTPTDAERIVETTSVGWTAEPVGPLTPIQAYKIIRADLDLEAGPAATDIDATVFQVEGDLDAEAGAAVLDGDQTRIVEATAPFVSPYASAAGGGKIAHKGPLNAEAGPAETEIDLSRVRKAYVYFESESAAADIDGVRIVEADLDLQAEPAETEILGSEAREANMDWLAENPTLDIDALRIVEASLDLQAEDAETEIDGEVTALSGDLAAEAAAATADIDALRIVEADADLDADAVVFDLDALRIVEADLDLQAEAAEADFVGDTGTLGPLDAVAEPAAADIDGVRIVETMTVTLGVLGVPEATTDIDALRIVEANLDLTAEDAATDIDAILFQSEGDLDAQAEPAATDIDAVRIVEASLALEAEPAETAIDADLFQSTGQLDASAAPAAADIDAVRIVEADADLDAEVAAAELDALRIVEANLDLQAEAAEAEIAGDVGLVGPLDAQAGDAATDIDAVRIVEADAALELADFTLDIDALRIVEANLDLQAEPASTSIQGSEEVDADLDLGAAAAVADLDGVRIVEAALDLAAEPAAADIDAGVAIGADLDAAAASPTADIDGVRIVEADLGLEAAPASCEIEAELGVATIDTADLQAEPATTAIEASVIRVTDLAFAPEPPTLVIDGTRIVNADLDTQAEDAAADINSQKVWDGSLVLVSEPAAADLDGVRIVEADLDAAAEDAEAALEGEVPWTVAADLEAEPASADLDGILIHEANLVLVSEPAQASLTGSEAVEAVIGFVAGGATASILGTRIVVANLLAAADDAIGRFHEVIYVWYVDGGVAVFLNGPEDEPITFLPGEAERTTHLTPGLTHKTYLPGAPSLTLFMHP